MVVKLKTSLQQTIKSFWIILPMILAIVGVIGIFKIFITKEMLSQIFNGNPFFDALKGVIAGAISVGQPFLSYIIGGEFL